MSSYHYSFYSPTDCTAWVFSHRFHCLLRIFSHRFHRSAQNFLLNIFSHRFHRFTQKLGCLQGGALVSSAPTKQTVHQPSKIDILPRNPQNPQNCLLSVFPHRFHRLTQIVWVPSRGCTCLRSALPLARARSAPTKQEVHQPSKIDILPRNPQNPQNCLLSVFPHRFHRLTQIVWVPSRGCTCLKCTNQARSAPTEQYRYTSCYVGALETSAPPEVSRFCEFCVFCGRTSPAEGSVNSACSVGGILRLRRQGYLRYYLPHPNHLCQSVKSVGEYPPAEGSVNSVQSVGGHCLLGWCT